MEQRRPSKLPEIKQTLTSKIRLLKANPLLQKEILDRLPKDDSKTYDLKYLAKFMNSGESIIERTPNNQAEFRVPYTDTKLIRRPPPKIELIPKSRSTLSISTPQHQDFVAGVAATSTLNGHKIRKFGNFPKPTTAKNIPSSKPKTLNKSQTSRNVLKPALKTSIRRSMSAEKFDPTIHLVLTDSKTKLTPGRKTVSFQDLNVAKSKVVPEVSPVNDASFTSARSSTTSFYTPISSSKKSPYRRTPHSIRNAGHLAGNLKFWLQKRGKSISDFRHLKCFGIFQEDKENIEEIIPDKSSNEELNNIKMVVNDEPPVDSQLMAKQILSDILELIEEGYTIEMCESWLQLIKEKFKHVETEPNYWECRAAIEQLRGNINGAVECYKTAIINGAEPKEIDISLDDLLKKFSILDIDVQIVKNKRQQRIIEDARNIFKSQIIQFAVRERNMKKNDLPEKRMIATPVRRSTRLSRSKYTTTPDVKIYDSLKDIQSPFSFSTNQALLN